MDEVELTADMHVAEAGRTLMSGQLALILDRAQGVRANADGAAVHEMRKAIRRTFTCFKLFKPYFEPGTFKPYKRGLRRIMKRLGRSRDLAVSRLKLNVYIAANQGNLDDLSSKWDERQMTADAQTIRYLEKSKQQVFLQEYRKFTETPGMGVLKPNPWAPVKLRHHLPIIVYQRVAAVRAFDDKVETADAVKLHRLRIQFKELRYMLEFFSPLLGQEIESVVESLKQSQEILGDLNDTLVALRLLEDENGLNESTEQYRAFQENEQKRLLQSYLPVWQQFDRPYWRRELAEAMILL